MAKRYTDEFKRKILELKRSGKRVVDLCSEYQISKVSISTWEKQYNNSGKFSIKDNLSESEKELRELKKENKYLKMENDILKQAALILGRKSE